MESIVGTASNGGKTSGSRTRSTQPAKIFLVSSTVPRVAGKLSSSALRSDDKHRVEAELVRQGVSLGRSLSKEDRIRIFWTPDAGDEDRLVQKEQGKKGLHHHRIRRLLKEADLQGAACTDKDLAQALDVSVRTIERDMKELRQEGLELLTRRRR